MPRLRRHASNAARQQDYRTRQWLLAHAPHVVYRQLGPHCTLYLSDWQTVFPLLPRHAAVVTDPPYRTSYDYTKARRRPSRWDRNYVGMEQPFDPTPWLQFPEVILFGADHYWAALPSGGSVVCWHKTPGRTPADFAPCEWIWLSKAGPPYYLPYLWAGGMREGEENYTCLPQKLHPAQKPVQLLQFLVEQTTAPVVLDPFMGSGTTLAACVRLGRPCIGVEMDAHYFQIACERLQREVDVRAHEPALFPVG